jgi:hypothetical protein
MLVMLLELAHLAKQLAAVFAMVWKFRNVIVVFSVGFACAYRAGFDRYVARDTTMHAIVAARPPVAFRPLVVAEIAT